MRGRALALSVALLCLPGLWAQQADSVVPANNSVSQPVPRLILFSGTLKDLAGKPLRGPVDLNFAIYQQQTEGEPLWQETQTLNLDEQGHYAVLLGATQPQGLPVELFRSAEARWLGVTAGNPSASSGQGLPEQPRTMLVSVPYALEANDAQMLGGKPASAFMLAPPAGTNGTTTNLGTLPVAAETAPATPTSGKEDPQAITAGGTANYIAGWVNSSTLGTSAIYQNPTTNYIGVGTTSPGQELDVVSHGGDSGTYISVGDFVGSDFYGFSQESLQVRNPNYQSGAGQEIFSIGAEGYLSNAGALTQSDLYIWDDKAGSGGAEKAVFQSGAGKIAFGNAITDSVALTGATFVIDSTGRAGIGTITPAHTLDVVGDINASTNISAGGNLTVTGTITGNGSGLTHVTASTVTCTGCVTNADLGSGVVTATNIASATITGANIASGTITGTNVSTTAGISATAITGTAATLAAANTFAATQAVSSGDFSVASGNLDLPQTTGASVGVLNLGGSPFLQACCSATQYNTFVGTNAGNFTTTGNQNTASGFQALNDNSSGVDNTATGMEALQFNTQGGNNTATGAFALRDNNTGGNNTASGYYALISNSSGSDNTAIGYEALGYNCYNGGASCAGNNNTALGYSAGVTGPANDYAQMTGANDTFIGSYAGPATATQLNNATAIGANAAVSESNALVLGSINGVNGASASVDVGIGTTTPAHVLDVVGDINASTNITAGGVFTGNGSGLTSVTSSDLTCSGCVTTADLGSGVVTATNIASATITGAKIASATITGSNLASSTITGSNVASATIAGSNLASATITGAKIASATITGSNVASATITGANIASGTITGTNVSATAGISATAITGTAATLAAANTFAATQTISSGDLGLPQTTSASVGVLTLGGNPFVHACCAGTQYNTFVGTNAGNFTTTGTGQNVAAGYGALHSNTSGDANVAIGFQALYANNGGFGNTASGSSALSANIGGDYNTANGGSALLTNTSGGDNTASGYGALDSNTSGSDNTASGYNALAGNCFNVSSCSANGNSAFGYNAGVTNNTSNENVTGVNNTFLGTSSGPGTSTQLTNATAIGANAVVSASNALVLGSINGVNGATASTSVGIGTPTPAATLNLNEGGTANADTLLVGSTSRGIELADTGSGLDVKGLGVALFINYGTGQNTYINGNGGDVGIGTISPGETLDVVGNVRTSTCYLVNSTVVSGTCSSDARLKTQIQPFQPSLDKLAQLQSVQFNWRATNPAAYQFGTGRATGLIAQDVQKVFPSMVSTDDQGYQQVNYTLLPFMLLEGVRELKSRNDDLRAELWGQQEQVARLSRSSAVKDAQVAALAEQNRGLAGQIAQLRKAQDRMAVMVARLVEVQARTAKTQPKRLAAQSGVKRVSKSKPAPQSETIAKVQF